jgi:hypothetical protein
MAKESPEDLVTIRREAGGRVSTVSRRSFEKVWKPRGYTLAPKGDQPQEPATVATAPTAKK